MPQPLIPRTIDDFTPQWLTSAFRAGGILPSGRVASLNIDALSEGVGFVGQVLRLTPTYEDAPSTAPPTAIAKIPSDAPGAREIAALYGLYDRELQFYRHLAHEVPFRTPVCFYGR